MPLTLAYFLYLAQYAIALDFRTIPDFRKDHLAELTGLFLQVLMLCQRAELVKLGHVALDGTKVRANASRH